MFEGDLGSALRAVALAHRDRPALWAKGKRLTYGELFNYAAGMAAALRANGVKVGDRVAILSHRTETVYAGIIAALLAGCTYVPLNTKFPAERNSKVLRASGAAALILETACALKLEQYVQSMSDQLLVITPEAGAPAVEGCGAHVAVEDIPQVDIAELDLGEPAPPYQPAYLLFTSGTTGEPKGVPISHANVAAYIEGVQAIGQITAEDRLLQLVELTFDLSVHDLFMAWLHGAELYSMAENNGLLAPRMIKQHELTSCALVPTTGGRAIQQGLVKPDSLPTLRTCFFAGEALPHSVAQAWAAAAPNARIVNLYGPTEATVILSSYEFDPAVPLDFAILPIGRPFPTQRMAIFDEQLRPVAPGESGEIFLAGSQLMSGYWNAPHLDAEKFTVIDGVRWYRTGDIGRWVEPHGFVFSGRADRQVKIRGYRVELQEIEGVVRRVSGSQEVAVLPWPRDAVGSYDYAVAFVGAPLGDAEALREQCRAIVAEYMAPERIFFVDSLPVNANGKVDYKVLASHSELAGL